MRLEVLDVYCIGFAMVVVEVYIRMVRSAIFKPVLLSHTKKRST